MNATELILSQGLTIIWIVYIVKLVDFYIYKKKIAELTATLFRLFQLFKLNTIMIFSYCPPNI